MVITNSRKEDIDVIFELYASATAYQKPRFKVVWPTFDRGMVETELLENRQWKLLIDGKIACIWATTYDDPLIWEERNIDPAVYIHRIATNPDFRGHKFVSIIVDWAIRHAKANSKKFIRLDTIGENEKLIEHYQACGFDFLGIKMLKNTEGLPSHYASGEACLFEILV